MCSIPSPPSTCESQRRHEESPPGLTLQPSASVQSNRHQYFRHVGLLDLICFVIDIIEPFGKHGCGHISYCGQYNNPPINRFTNRTPDAVIQNMTSSGAIVSSIALINVRSRAGLGCEGAHLQGRIVEVNQGHSNT